MIHQLKTWPEPFEAVRFGSKTYEIRKADRPFTVGDMLLLREWDPITKRYSGASTWRRVTYITAGGSWGLPRGMCVMSIVKVSVGELLAAERGRQRDGSWLCLCLDVNGTVVAACAKCDSKRPVAEETGM